MEIFKTYLERFFVLLLAFIPFLPEFGVIDIIGVQFYYLAISQTIVFLYLFLFKRNNLIESIFSKNPSIVFYTTFVLISFISISWSFNKTEALIEGIRLFCTLIAFINIFTLISIDKSNRKLILSILIILSSIESINIFRIFIENYNFLNPPTRLRVFQGFTYNQNVAAFSILFKIPIILYLAHQSKNRFFKTFLFLLLSISFFNILIIGSRGSLITLTGISLIYFSILFFRFIENNFKKNVIIFLSLLVLTTLSQIFLYQKSDSLRVTDRITSYNDESTNYRINFFTNAIETFIENPFTGVGIGNWKITSIENLNFSIKGYLIPYHVHNDFLQVAAELGLPGLILFILFFLTPLYYSLKRAVKIKKDRIIVLSLSLTLIAFIGDSMVNFPRARPNSLINLIYALSLLSFIVFEKSKFKVNRRLTFLGIFLVLVISPLSIYVNSKVFKSYKEQKYLIYDFNSNPDNFKTSVEEVLLFEDEIPNISTVTFPLKTSKGMYLLQNNRYEEGLKMVKEGQRHNPFLGLTDFEIGKYYLYKEENLDSAYKYLKLSNKKLPLNNAQNSILQIILTKQEKLNESKELFESIKEIKNEVIWQNFILFDVLYKFNNDIEFETWDINNIKEAMSLFPDNLFFQQCDKIVSYGEGIVVLANSYDNLAKKEYSKGEYNKAIDNWEKAIEIIPNDKAYFYNIIQASLNNKNLELALEWIKKFEDSEIYNNDGKFEFLKALYFLELKNKFKGCELLNQSIDKGYNGAISAKSILGC